MSTRPTTLSRWCAYAMHCKRLDSYAELATALGVTRQAVSLWHRGERKSVALDLQPTVYRYFARCVEPKRRRPLTDAEFAAGPPLKGRK